MPNHIKFSHTEKETRKNPPMSQGGLEAWRLTEHQLISFNDRITYTFSYGKEVGSLHFDRGRGEIFFKGHNIRNMDLEDWHWQTMEKLRQLLQNDEKSKSFAEPYGRALDKVAVEKRNQSTHELTCKKL